MKITMIGDRGCGKTTFMAGLYRDMTNPEFRLNIKLSNKEQRARVDQIAQNLSYGYYPSATSFEQEYKFDFTIDQVKILDFSWYDYRGGALLEDQDSQEAQRLFEDLKYSDGLLVFIDTTTCNDSKWTKNSRYWRTIQRAVRSHAQQANTNYPRSLGFILTKVDVEVQNNSPYLIEENVANLLDSLPNREYLCGIAAYSAINSEGSLNTMNVFFRIMTPFILSVLQEQAYKIEQANQMNEILNNIDNNYNSAGFLDDFFSGLFGDTSNRDYVAHCVNLLKEFPLFQSWKHRALINSFLNHIKNQSFFDSVFGQDHSYYAQQDFDKIMNIWVKYVNDINALYGDWSDIIMEHLNANNGIDKGGYILF